MSYKQEGKVLVTERAILALWKWHNLMRHVGLSVAICEGIQGYETGLTPAEYLPVSGVQPARRGEAVSQSDHGQTVNTNWVFSRTEERYVCKMLKARRNF